MIRVQSVNRHREIEWFVEVETWQQAWHEIDACGADRKDARKISDHLLVIYSHAIKHNRTPEMTETMNQKLTKLNEKMAERTPGYYVKANETGRFTWYLIGPDGKVHYERDSFEAIESIALR